MKKTIIILEDNLYTAEDMIEEIKNNLMQGGFVNITNRDVEIKVANSIDEANELLESISKEDIICIIADLNMNPEGLTDEQKKETNGAILTGWVWLYSYVWQELGMQEKYIIFYSAFINYLESNQKYKDLHHNKNKIKLILKSEHGMSNLCKELLRIVGGLK